MKTTRTRRLSITATCVLLATLNARAADENLRPIAFQNGVNQQTLSTETAELAKQITALIEELQRNGFPIQSLNGLTELAAQLNSLGGTEMAGIASRLRKLGESAAADPRATATEAYLAQQSIESRLKNLARQISIQQLREETARRLEALINRQLAIQRETRAIATKPEAERQRILESDQSGIGEDLTTFFQTGENLLGRLREGETPTPGAATPTAPAPGTPPTAATAPGRPGAPASAAPAAPAGGPTFTERINGTYLTTLSTEATDFIKGKRYPDAYARQESLIAELRKVLQNILSSLPKEQRLASALQQVSALRQQEEANQQAKTPPTPEAKQAAADQAQNLANQTAQISPEASAALREAQKKLQEDKKADSASAQQQAKADAQKQDGKKDDKGQQPQPNAQQPNAAQTAQNAQKPDQKQDGKQDDKGQQQPQPNASQTAQNDQKQDGQKQDGEKQDGQKPDAQQTAQTPQAGQDKGEQQDGQKQDGKQDQQAGQSEAAKALAAAENALRKELAQVQQQQQAGQQTAQQQAGQKQDGQKQDGQKQDGQQTAQNGQQKPGEQQAGQKQDGQKQDGQQTAQNGEGQPKPGEGQQQQNGQGKAQQQTAQNGQPDPNAQPKDGTGEGPGDAQQQIAGHGNNNGDPAQVLGAMKREEREAFSALQNERYPAEYSAWVQQYWRNLAQDQ